MASKFYEVDYKTGKIKRKRVFCPRCKGAFLADHSDKSQNPRLSCGSCGYTEFKK